MFCDEMGLCHSLLLPCGGLLLGSLCCFAKSNGGILLQVPPYNRPYMFLQELMLLLWIGILYRP